MLKIDACAALALLAALGPQMRFFTDADHQLFGGVESASPMIAETTQMGHDIILVLDGERLYVVTEEGDQTFTLA